MRWRRWSSRVTSVSKYKFGRRLVQTLIVRIETSSLQRQSRMTHSINMRSFGIVKLFLKSQHHHPDVFKTYWKTANMPLVLETSTMLAIDCARITLPTFTLTTICLCCSSKKQWRTAVKARHRRHSHSVNAWRCIVILTKSVRCPCPQLSTCFHYRQTWRQAPAITRRGLRYKQRLIDVLKRVCQRHMHLGRKSHTCNICDQGFSSKSTLSEVNASNVTWPNNGIMDS